MRAGVDTIALLDQVGFRPDEQHDLARSWAAYNPKKRDLDAEQIEDLRRDSIKKSLLTIHELSGEGPRVASDIHRVFRIRNFGFYAAETLHGQLVRFQEPGEAAAETLTQVIGGAEDHCGSNQDIEDGFGLAKPIYTEAESLDDIVHTVVPISRRFGAIDNLIVKAHGAPDCIQWRSSGDGMYTRSASVERAGAVKRLTSTGILRPQAKIILASCNTGEVDGLAQTVSRVSGLTVVAANAGVKGHIETDQDSGRLRIVMEDVKNINAELVEIMKRYCESSEAEMRRNAPTLFEKIDKSAVVTYEAGELVNPDPYLATR